MWLNLQLSCDAEQSGSGSPGNVSENNFENNLINAGMFVSCKKEKI